MTVGLVKLEYWCAKYENEGCFHTDTQTSRSDYLLQPPTVPQPVLLRYSTQVIPALFPVPFVLYTSEYFYF